MFSFRTTPIEDQLDKCLNTGKVAVFCTQNCYNVSSGHYLYEIFASRGNLLTVFSPRDSELCPETNHIDFDVNLLKDANAVVVEIQDVGTRYFNYTKDVLNLIVEMSKMDQAPSLYIVDHLNPCGRVIEGTFKAKPDFENIETFLLHKHGLTLGEIANLFVSEIGARFPLHVISAIASDSTREALPWHIAPSSDMPGLFTFSTYPGCGLFNHTNITPGIGTARPYEYFGAPYIKNLVNDPLLPSSKGIVMRPCSFTPMVGLYKNKRCQGYQIIQTPDAAGYHNLLHVLSLIRYFRQQYPSEFRLNPEFGAKLGDNVLEDYIYSRTDYRTVVEHLKDCEQKWLRKTRKFLLYNDNLYRNK